MHILLVTCWNFPPRLYINYAKRVKNWNRIQKADFLGCIFFDVKDTHECYMNFENGRISLTRVRYSYEIRDILVPILHAR